MKRILSAFLLTLSLSTQAGLPPTTLSGQSQTVKPTTFSFKTPYNQSTKISGTESLIETGNANVLADPGAEAATTPWSAYKDAAGVLPVDGTAGTALYVTCANSATSPLAGTKSFLITKTANNAQGEGCSIPFTISTSSIYKVNRLAFDYAIASGTYADDEIEWFVYDVTNGGTPKPFTPSKLKNHSLPSETFAPNGEFQASNSTSYRLIAHVAGTSASAYGLKFDNFKLGVFEKTYGSAVTDWVSYTPTFIGLGTVTAINVKSRRVGDTLEIKGIFTAGTTTAVNASVSLGFGGANANVSIDTNKAAIGFLVGKASQNFSSSTFFNLSTLVLSSSAIAFSQQASTANELTAGLGNAMFPNGAIISFTAEVPIQGWSSSQIMSNDADTREVSFISNTIANNTVTLANSGLAASIQKPSNIVYDSHGAYNVSTGVYTVKVPGRYRAYVSTTWQPTSGNWAINIYHNGVMKSYSPAGVAAAFSEYPTSVVLNCIAGDTIDIRTSVNSGTGNNSIGTSAVARDIFTIERISGPSQIAASESVSFSANTSTTAATTSAPFIYTVEDHDNTNSYSTVTGKFTAPSPGKYFFNSIYYAGATQIVGQFYKNGVQIASGTPTTTGSFSGLASASMQLLAGDTVEVRPHVSATASGGATFNQFSGFRMGNY